MEKHEIIGYSRKGNPYIGYDKDGERIYLLRCEFCKNDFTNKYPITKFCSDKCKNERDKQRKQKIKEQSERIDKNTEGKNVKLENKMSKSSIKYKELNAVYKNILSDKYDDTEYYNIIKLIELSYKDSSKEKITITIDEKDMDELTLINLIGSFFYKYKRLPNADDVILLPKKKNRRRIWKLCENYDNIKDKILYEFNCKYSDNKNAVKQCYSCNRLFSEYHSGFKHYCSVECFDINEKTNICAICKTRFIGKNGYDNICADCSAKLDDDVCASESNKENLIKEIISVRVLDIIKKSKIDSNIFNGRIIDYNNVGGFTETIKNKVRERDNYICQLCGKDTNLHVHHIVPRRKGGNHNLDNLILLCSSCHRSIETGDESHAIIKCTKNALKYGGYMKADNYNFNDNEIINMLLNLTEKVFEELSQKDEYEELLVYIDNTLDGLGF